jgi:eukaryotic-like serine/threonine-protein kinase
VAKFTFGQRIGSGGFGVVLHCTREEDGLPFAVKQLAQEHASDAEVVERFRREVRIQRSLQHPNILPIVGANLSVSPPWFVMPVAERTLLDEIQSGLNEQQVDEHFDAILSAVEYAHTHPNRVVHRDLKPENVMVSHNGEPQVSDFGLGKNLLSDSTTLTRTHLGAGSFPYVAPEQMLSLGDADERADIYALGKILQAMLTRQLPVMTNDPNVPRKYQYFISRCTAQKREDRYQNLTEVRGAFAQLRHGVERPRPAAELINDLIEEWRQLPEGNDLEPVRKIHELFEANADNRLLYQATVPALPGPMIRQYIDDLRNDFRRLLDRYDEHVSGSLDFDYCDVVTNLYRDIWQMTDDVEIRRLILSRLVQMGPAHNRYHVGDVVAQLLRQATDESDVMMVVDVLKQHPDEAQWFKPNPTLRTGALAPPIDDCLFGEL